MDDHINGKNHSIGFMDNPGVARPGNGNGNVASTGNAARLKRNLSQEAISLALKGEWERATEVNRAILELFENEVDAMNRLGKALKELARYGDAKEVLDRLVAIAPYNNIAKKNIARLAHLSDTPTVVKQVRSSGGSPQLFIEESGRSGMTVLKKMASRQVIARVAPSDAADLVLENNALNVYAGDNEYLGQIEPKLARRLIRLMYGGNKYDAAVVGINDHAVSIIVRETRRDPSLRGVCSFPVTLKAEHRVYLGEDLERYISEENLDDDDAPSIDEEAMDAEWADNE